MSAQTLPWPSQIPHVSGAIRRPRLLARLHEAIDHKLVLVVAPPGYGKTTIAAQFAAQLPNHAIAWHAVEERERDLPNLFNQSLTILGDVAPDIRSVTPTPGYTPFELVALLAEKLRETTAQEILYVIDDIHLLAGSPAAEVWLQTLVELVPPNIHLLLIGRILPNLPLTEMIARGEVLALGQEQLRFTTEEIFSLAQATLGAKATMADAEALAARLEGWPAGTVLALHPLPADLEQAMLHGGKGPEALFDALARSTLDAQLPGLRNFLLASSTLERMTPDQCSKVLQLEESSYWLDEAQKRSLFLSRVSGGLVYHRLFRNFLQAQLRDENPHLFVTLHTRAARWYEIRNRIDESFEHYMTAGLVESAANVAERVAQAYFSQGKVEALLKWRARLGQAGVLTPSLLYNCARVQTDRYNYDEATRLLDEAERGFAEFHDRAGIRDVRLQHAFIQLQQGDYQRSTIEAAQLLESDAEGNNLRGRALKIMGVAHLRLGEIEAAATYLEQAVELHRTDGDAHGLANVLQDLGVTRERQGRLSDASACLQEAVALRRSLGSPGSLAAALNNLGYYYHLGCNYEQALATLQQGLSIVAKVPNRRIESALLWSMGDLRRDQGAFEEAFRLHKRALELVGSSEPWLRCAVLVSSATLRRWEGKLNESLALAETAYSLATPHNLALEEALARAALWVCRAVMGEAARAFNQLEEVITELQGLGAHFELVWLYTLQSYVSLLRSNGRDASRYLMLATREADLVGSRQTLVSEIVHNAQLDAFVRQHADRYASLAPDLDNLRSAQTTKATPYPQELRINPTITYSLRVATMGREEIERDGEIVSMSEWRSTTAREMFLYLLFEGGQTREQISLEFWPDSSPKRVRSNFHTTLYRARQALRENVIVFQDGEYLINPDLDLWCDVHEMEQLIQEARLLSPRDARTEDLWRAAVDLYSGDFLPTLDAEWVVWRRESLQEDYLEALIGLGDCARARRNVREAVAAYKRALDIDPYREDVHRAIMSCYAQAGENKQVLTHFQTLENLLRRELAISPSAETVALAKKLLR